MRNFADIAQIAAEILGKTIYPHHLETVPSTGLTHDHIHISGTGKLLRIPVAENQLGLSAEAYLQQQQACYAAAHPSGHTPKCFGYLPPSEVLPYGALIIEQIMNIRPVILPQDWPAIALAMAAMHQIKPEDCDASKMEIAEYPFASQGLMPGGYLAEYLAHESLSDEVRKILQAALRPIQNEIEELKAQTLPVRLIGGDAHPANFGIDCVTGKAWFLDLEWVSFGLPLIDLGDGSLVITQAMEPNLKICYDRTGQQAFKNAWHVAADEELQKLSPELHALSDRIRGLASIAWLISWQCGNPDPERASTFNFQQLADVYLQPENLKAYLQHGKDPLLSWRLPIRPGPAATPELMASL